MTDVSVVAFNRFVAIPDEKVCNAVHVRAIDIFAYSDKDERVTYAAKEAVVR
jgi:hypothetical protein